MAHSRQGVPNAESQKLPRAVDQEGCPDPSPSGALIPEDSDFFPSVSLAAALLLIFISVLPLLSQPGMVFVPFRKEAHFHPLLYIQPRSTQLTIETLAKSQKETTMVLAVAKEHATQTLMCFSKNVMALLSKQGQGHPVIRQSVEVEALEDRRNSSVTRASGVLSVSVITKIRGHTPHCTILRPPSLLEISLHQERGVTVRRESSTIAHDLLELVHKTGQVPETFKVKAFPRCHVKVLHVLGDPYLESGIVC
ncbi:uncharacterized protein LOC130291019 [Hyla sarda]|uniref:uncharacterized protein LOC130291019 n=1 Tax=Hyla sarda TaxID=327740 RepID=UPI0024C37B73|nr:uncharacterized protein LOC130291019 [Hyla sarda]